jgi:hypothetical protein
MNNKPTLSQIDLAGKYALDNNYNIVYNGEFDGDDEFAPTRIAKTGDVFVMIDGFEYYNHQAIAELYTQLHHPLPIAEDTRIIDDFDFE